MKRLIFLLFALLILLSGCAVTPDPAQELSDPGLISVDALLDRLLTAVPEGSKHPEVVAAEELTSYLLIYGIDPALVQGCAIARLGGSQVFELAVIDLTARSTSAEEALLAYRLRRQGDFTGYAPDQAAIAEKSKLFAVEGDLRLVLAITEDTGEVADALASAGYTRVTEVDAARLWENEPLSSAEPDPVTTAAPSPSAEPSPEPSPEPSTEPSEEPSPEPSFELPSGWKKYSPPDTDDMTIYDTTALLAAWEAGSPEGLNRKDRWVYERCAEVIDAVITEDMTDYEKEWAIYSWLITHVEYDWRQNDPTQTAPRSSFQPYGTLVEGTAVCLGYATTFQLFMDMLGIECITVVGAAFDSSGDHAWNMVRLNGEWYCADATWDLGRSTLDHCRYFNVTSDWMAITDHQWDYANTPMATAEDGGK